MEPIGERLIPDAHRDRFAYAEHWLRYTFAGQFVNGLDVLDVACGSGYGTSMLAHAGAKRVVGVDVSTDAVEYARQRYAGPTVAYAVADAGALPFDRESFDVVVSFETIEHLRDPDAFLQEVKRCMRSAGLFVVSTPNALRHPFGNAYHVHEYTLDGLMSLLKKEFPCVTVCAQNEWIASAITSADVAEGPCGQAARVLKSPVASSLGARPLAQASYHIALCSAAPVHGLRDHLVVSTNTEHDEMQQAISRLETEKQEALISQFSLRGQVLEGRSKWLDAQGEIISLKEDAMAAARRLQELERAETSLRAALVEAEAHRSSMAEQLHAFEVANAARRDEEHCSPEADGVVVGETDSARALVLAAEQRASALAERVSVLDRLVEEASVREATARQSLDDLANALRVANHTIERVRTSKTFRLYLLYARTVRPTLRMVRSAPRKARTAFKVLLREGPASVVRVARESAKRGYAAVPERLPGRDGASQEMVGQLPSWRRLGGGAKHGPTSHWFRALFLVGCLEGESKRYRVHNMMEYLRAAGYECEQMYEVDVDDPRKAAWMKGFDILVLFRAAMSDYLRRVIEIARNSGIPLVFDIDDLIFDPAVVGAVDEIKDWPVARREEYLDGVRRYRHTLLACDAATLTTEPLAAAVRRSASIPTYVVRNGVNAAQITASQAALESRAKTKDGRVVIGYFSGTNTHRKDFREAASAIERVLELHPNVTLLIVGPLDLPAEYPLLRARVERHAFVEWGELPALIAQADINIAPLERDNIFCECKSELKYFESALLGVPTVASPSSPFANAIRDGDTGLLSHTEAEWFSNLERLVVSSEERRRMGSRAQRDALEKYTGEALVQPLIRSYVDIIRRQRTRAGLRADGLRIGWVMTAPIPGSGGHRMAFRAIRGLAERGHDVTLYVQPDGKYRSSSEVARLIEDQFFGLGAQVVLGVDAIAHSDALVATHWSTAYVVQENRCRTKVGFYFVQDFEPMFSAMGSDYILAENTYKMGLTCITAGPWCAHLLKQKFSVEAYPFDFPIDRDTYCPLAPSVSEGVERPCVVFFARPEMTRRCYPLGVAALRLVHQARPDVELVLFGSSSIDVEALGFPATSIGVIREQRDLADLYRRAHVGMAFSTTNPSMVPYEMMACGLPVVDLDYNDNYVNYGGRDNVALAEPDAESIARTVLELLRNPSARQTLRARGLAYVQGFGSESDMIDRVEDAIVRKAAWRDLHPDDGQ